MVKELEQASKTAPSVLEGLQRTLANLREAKVGERMLGWDGSVSRVVSFQFDDWSSCTCGHVYLAATGHVGSVNDVTQRDRPRSRYGQMLKAIVDANKDRREFKGQYDAGYLESASRHSLVSGMTVYLAEARASRRGVATSERITKNAAISLLERAIEHQQQVELAAKEKVKAA
jgi:hypothetical protein